MVVADHVGRHGDLSGALRRLLGDLLQDLPDELARAVAARHDGHLVLHLPEHPRREGDRGLVEDLRRHRAGAVRHHDGARAVPHALQPAAPVRAARAVDQSVAQPRAVRGDVELPGLGRPLHDRRRDEGPHAGLSEDPDHHAPADHRLLPAPDVDRPRRGRRRSRRDVDRRRVERDREDHRRGLARGADGVRRAGVGGRPVLGAPVVRHADPVRDGRGRVPAAGAVQDPQEVRHALGRAGRLERDLLGVHPGAVPEPRRRRRDHLRGGAVAGVRRPGRAPHQGARHAAPVQDPGRVAGHHPHRAGTPSRSSRWPSGTRSCARGSSRRSGLSLLFLASGPILYPIARYFKKRRGETDVFAPAGITEVEG